jgi:hypothetical protein
VTRPHWPGRFPAVSLDPADRPQQLSVGLVDQYTVIVRVGHQDFPLAADGQPSGATGLLGGRFPTAKKMSVQIEDLNPGSHVDDVELLAVVDGHRPGLLQPPRGDPPSSPNGFRVTGRNCRGAAAGHQRDPEQFEKLKGEFHSQATH